MKITKLIHSCLLVEMPERTALFDPGMMSREAIDVSSLEHLDDIIITHNHFDHMDIEKIKELKEKFPDARVKAASEATGMLHDEGIDAEQDAIDGIAVFDAPHEPVEPLIATPDNMGVHYIDKLTHPGDSFGFDTTMPILALPVTAPWGATVDAVNLAIKLKPKYVIPIHDWHWSDAAREQLYPAIENALKQEGITFLALETGKPVNVDV